MYKDKYPSIGFKLRNYGSWKLQNKQKGKLRKSWMELKVSSNLLRYVLSLPRLQGEIQSI